MWLRMVKENKTKVKDVKPVKKDSFKAKLAFWLSMGFWLPLFNVGFSLVAIILAVKALKSIDNEPKRNGGRAYAIIALIIGLTSFIGSILFLAVYTYRKLTCDALAAL